MLAYGDARVTRRGHNRHRHRHHRRQSGGRRRGWPGGRAGTHPARVAGADAGPAGAQRRRGVAARPAGGAATTGAPRCRGGRGFGDGAVADRGRRRRPSDHAGAALRRQPGPGGRERIPASPFPVGEAAEFLRWTAAQAPDAAGYWPAPAVANYALAGEAVVDFPTAYTASPLFDGSWNAAGVCRARCDGRPDAAGRGTRRGGRAAARIPAPCWRSAPSTRCASRWWPAPTTTATCWCCAAPR